jgi:hypothetical protein
MPADVGAPPLPGGANYVRLFDRVMECAGSRINPAGFVFAHKDINDVKINVSCFPLRRIPNSRRGADEVCPG